MQPCYLPWRGYFALVRSCELLVHLDDVPLPRGRSYQTRIALQTDRGRLWLSLPVRRRAGQLVRDATLADDRWRRKHRSTLRQHLPAATELIGDLLDRPWTHVADLDIALSERIAGHLTLERRSIRSSSLGVETHKSERILEICRRLGATTYVTGHGGSGYLDHERLEQHGIETRYLDYDLSPYPRRGAPPDPYQTVLDVIEHAPEPLRHVDARLVPWREHLSTLAGRPSPPPAAPVLS